MQKPMAVELRPRPMGVLRQVLPRVVVHVVTFWHKSAFLCFPISGVNKATAFGRGTLLLGFGIFKKT
jgi:hypothetical protein